jgi:hypothetical protein
VLDIALAPWGLRLFVLEHYRGLQVCVWYCTDKDVPVMA